MGLAHPKQRFQDWFTQQWVILRGSRIDPGTFRWLLGPFGNLNGIGLQFLTELAEKENLVLQRNTTSRGLIASIDELALPDEAVARLAPSIINFYEKTYNYTLDLGVHWNPLFRCFGILLGKLFSNRLNQLNIPTKNGASSEAIESEIITLSDPATGRPKYTIWLRTSGSSGHVLYSGVYGTCSLPSGKRCVKAVFPLPKGNATVLMAPSVGANGELILDSSGTQMGDAGFYFLLNDSKGRYWAQFVRSFRDRLVMWEEDGFLSAEQTLTLWHLPVLKFKYKIKEKG